MFLEIGNSEKCDISRLIAKLFFYGDNHLLLRMNRLSSSCGRQAGHPGHGHGTQTVRSPLYLSMLSP